MSDNSKRGLAFALFYLMVFSLAEALTLYVTLTDSFGASLASIFPLLLTLPWNIVTITAMDLLGYVPWYEYFIGFGFWSTASIPVMVAAVMNATTLYFIGRRAFRDPRVAR